MNKKQFDHTNLYSESLDIIDALHENTREAYCVREKLANKLILLEKEADKEMKTKAKNYYEYLKIMKKELNKQMKLLKEVCE
ncbi:MAG: hypothetical protein R3230_01550 [Nitrosopumilaceae archaeon]|nr:hypothetical protein [Nitrosopumilaceae archaeon]